MRPFRSVERASPREAAVDLSPKTLHSRKQEGAPASSCFRRFRTGGAPTLPPEHARSRPGLLRPVSPSVPCKARGVPTSPREHGGPASGECPQPPGRVPALPPAIPNRNRDRAHLVPEPLPPRPGGLPHRLGSIPTCLGSAPTSTRGNFPSNPRCGLTERKAHPLSGEPSRGQSLIAISGAAG